jgi:hypothetical protein
MPSTSASPNCQRTNTARLISRSTQPEASSETGDKLNYASPTPYPQDTTPQEYSTYLDAEHSLPTTPRPSRRRTHSLSRPKKPPIAQGSFTLPTRHPNHLEVAQTAPRAMPYQDRDHPGREPKTRAFRGDELLDRDSHERSRFPSASIWRLLGKGRVASMPSHRFLSPFFLVHYTPAS